MGFGVCSGCRVKWTAPQGITRYVFMLSDFYDIDTEPVIQLSAFYGEPKNILEKCIILFSKEIHDYLLCNYECKEIVCCAIMNAKKSALFRRATEI